MRPVFGLTKCMLFQDKHVTVTAETVHLGEIFVIGLLMSEKIAAATSSGVAIWDL
jgi:hypothetical protein